MKGYGVFEGTVEILDFKIFAKREDEFVKYTRIWPGGSVTKMIFRPTRLELAPIYPVLLPRLITTYIHVKLIEPILVPARGEALIYIKIPVDLAVYAYGPYRRFSIIDIFSIKKIKYTLYGIPDRGLIARYCESLPYTFIPDMMCGEAVSLIQIRNRYNDWVEVGRILLDAQILKLYYLPGTCKAYTQAIVMVTNSPVTATIYYGRKIEPQARPIHDPPGLRPPRLLAKTEMLWGLTY